jgi:hypothetical protein
MEQDIYPWSSLEKLHPARHLGDTFAARAARGESFAICKCDASRRSLDHCQEKSNEVGVLSIVILFAVVARIL